MKHQNTSGFSIVLAMGLVLILSFTGLYLIEYMVPFSKNIKGIENASQAFYESYGGLENSTLLVYSGSVGQDYVRDFGSVQDVSYDVVSSGSLIPLPGKGRSQFDENWNRISQDNPISILVGSDRLNSTSSQRIRLSLRVPDIDGDGNPDELETADGDDDIVLWQLSSLTDTMFSRSGSLIKESDINAGLDEESFWGSNTLSQGVIPKLANPPNPTDPLFRWFYDNNSSPCNIGGNECILKISIINPLISSRLGSGSIPYLEYQIHTNSDISIPLGESYVVSRGKSYGFSKTLELTVPMESTNSAFDFTVLQ